MGKHIGNQKQSLRFVAAPALAVGAFLSLFQIGCSGSGGGSSAGSSSYDTSSAMVASSVVAGSAASADDSSTGTVVAMSKPANQAEGLVSLLVPQAHAATCTSSVAVKGQTCSSANVSLTLGGCTTSNGNVSWTGTELLAFDSSGTCTGAVATGSGGGLMKMSQNASVTMTTSSGVTRTNSTTGGIVTQNSGNSGGYSATVTGGSTLTCTGTTCASGRTLNIAGLQRIEYASASAQAAGTAKYNHSINTPVALAFSGTDSAGTKTITQGTLVLQHNLAKYTATSQVTTALTFTAGCCFPTGGTLTTTFTGSRTGSETVTFGPTCGVGSVSGNAISLTHCL